MYYTLSLITIIFSFTHTLSYLIFLRVCLGMVLVESGYNTNSGTSGKVLVTTSDTTDESSGSTSIATGSSSHDNSGTVSLSTGESGTNYSGDVRVYSSDGRRGSGVVSISTGASNDKVGDISLTTGKVMRSIYSSPKHYDPERGGDIALETVYGALSLSTGDGLASSSFPGDVSVSGGDISLTASSSVMTTGGSISMITGSSKHGNAGDISIETGLSEWGGGNINIFASAPNTVGDRWLPDPGHFRNKEISFGFEEIRPESSTHRVALQLKRTRDSTRLTSTVPLQVTTVQYSSDMRIKKDFEDVDTEDLLDRIRQIELREYGYTDEWKDVRGIEKGAGVRVRGVIAQELHEVFPEHVQILEEMSMGDVKFKDFHQVDKQGLVMDCECNVLVLLAVLLSITDVSYS